MQDKKEDRLTIYEVGYLIASSVPEEKVEEEVNIIKKIIADNGASVISDEFPKRQPLAYTIRRKTVAGSYDKFDEAYFGWVKFEVGSSSIASIKKAIEIIPSVIRFLVITTVRENTYLGKHAPTITQRDVVSDGVKAEDKEPVKKDENEAPATIEEIDKSIDAMVKEA
jgi:ribosomal protein S6